MQHLDSKAFAHDEHPLKGDLVYGGRHEVQRRALVESALAEMSVALEECRLVQALGAFREAANLSREFPALRKIICSAAIEQAEPLASRNWRVAESLLEEALHLDASFAIPAAIRHSIQKERREESIGNVLAEAARADVAGTLAATRRRLALALGDYPGEARLVSRLESVDALLVARRRRQEAEAKKRDVAAREARVRNNLMLVKAAAAHAREFEKSGLAAEALEQFEFIRTIDPVYPGLEAEIVRFTEASKSTEVSTGESAVDGPLALVPRETIAPAGPKIIPKFSIWSLAKIELTVAAALLLAGLVVWTMRHPRLFASSRPAPLAVAVARPETGTLLVESTVPGPELFVNNRKYAGPSNAGMLAISLPPNTYEVRASRRGYIGYGPVEVSVAGGRETKLKLQLNPERASLNIQGALPGTRVKVDGAPAGVASANQRLTLDLAPGNHLIKLSKDGFVSKRLRRQLASGETVFLASSDARLESPAPGLAALPVELPRLQKQSVASQPLLSAYPDGPGRVKPLDLPSRQNELKPPGPDTAEQSTWQTANLLDRNSLANYTAQFPSGRHYLEAQQALAQLRDAELLKQESAAVLTVLRQYADAWSSKDLDSILALQHTLDRRIVKEQLSPVKALVMRIAPASDPRIEGQQATVACRRQVVETFSDGVEKQTPESLVTFVLSKRNGAWTIDGTR
jgi:hypothetical protein